MTSYQDSLGYSNKILEELRASLAHKNKNPKEIVVTCGSYSRGEASPASDIDYFLIVPAKSDGTPEPDPARISQIEAEIKSKVPKGPAPGGAFANYQTREEILGNIGGQEDDNDNITRRILFLLEGNWLSGEKEFSRLRREVLEKYIAPTITDHQLALFLLNDVIRYYRTMAVDYEFKTVQATTRKPWAVRNIKLIFSRKLLYASGLFSIALTADQRFERKIEILEQMFAMPCIPRLQYICGTARTEKLFSYYEDFLGCISDPEKREHLEQLKFEDRSSDRLFRDIKNEGHAFTQELQLLFEKTFHSTHPIHRAVIF